MTPAALPWGELGNGSVGSPKLEGSDALEILALEKNAGSSEDVGGGRVSVGVRWATPARR